MINPEEFVCSICLLQQKTPITISDCNHIFCHSCITVHLKSLIDQGCRRLENFRCPEADCQKLIPETELEKRMDFEYFNKLTNKIAYEHSVLCPECRTRIDIIGNPETWRCFNCYTQICKFCKASDHEGKCQTQSVYFNEVRTTIQDQQLGYCPSCLTPFMKDDNCDHVTCDRPGCEFQFCFYCAVSYSPIYNHGGNYHRTDCRNYEQWQDFVPYFSHDCIQCVKQGNNDGCPLPTETRQSFLKGLIMRAQGRSISINKEE